MKLVLNALAKFMAGVILVGCLLFLPAGTLRYPGGWLFMGVLFVPMMIVGAILLVRAPSLLEKRLDHKEKEAAQRGVIALSGLMFPVGFIVSALDFRFGWSQVPAWCMIVAAVLFLAGYLLYAEVMRENAYLSRTVKVQEGQKVIDTGLYGVVRHPMYLATLFMFLPLAVMLGSFWGLIPFALYPAMIVVRILNEEKVLTEGLEGYATYREKVRYRLLPLIW